MTDIRVDWYQSDSFVNIDIFCKNCDPQRQLISFDDRSVSIHLQLPAESSFKVGNVKITIQLRKQVSGQRWETLEEAPKTIEEKLEYPSSSKAKHDWDKLEKEIAEQKEEEKSIEAFLKGLYANASDETRKAMAKSFIESKGTVLSTNWNEVGSKKVEPSPPQGFDIQK